MIDQRDPPNPLGAGGVAAGRAGDVVEAGEGAVLGRDRERPLRVQIERDRERRTDRAVFCVRRRWLVTQSASAGSMRARRRKVSRSEQSQSGSSWP